MEQGLLLDIRRLLKDDFLLQQDGAPAHRSCYVFAYLHSQSRALEFTEPKNWTSVVWI